MDNKQEFKFELIKFFDNYQFIKPIKKYNFVRSGTTFISAKNVIDLFKIDLESHYEARFGLMLHLHGMAHSEIENMFYWEFEKYLIKLSEYLKEKQKAEEGANKEYKQNMPDMSKYNKQMKAPSFKAPKF